MQLVDEGKLELDDRLEQHLPGVAHGAPTLRRMLAHASGLQREPPGEIWETLVFPGEEELLERLGEAEQVLGAGQAWHYSNLAYALLGHVVARIVGTPFREHIERRFLWWSEGDEVIFSWRGGRLEARLATDSAEKEPSVFEQLGGDRFRTVSGRELGELLRVVRDDDGGGVVKLYWATYPFTREPEIFGSSSATGSGRLVL